MMTVDEKSSSEGRPRNRIVVGIPLNSSSSSSSSKNKSDEASDKNYSISEKEDDIHHKEPPKEPNGDEFIVDQAELPTKDHHGKIGKSHPMAVDQKSSSKNEGQVRVHFRIKNNQSDASSGQNLVIGGKEDAKQSPTNRKLRPRRDNHRKLFADESIGAHAELLRKKKKMPSFSIALTAEEINKDILKMSGAVRLQRKPKKINRPIIVQRALDRAFPGPRSSSGNPRSYGLHD